jgi:hypothetical protein
MLKINIGKHKLAIFAAFFISINIVSAIRVKHAHNRPGNYSGNVALDITAHI